MTPRSRAREVVLQLLYQHDQNRHFTPDAARAFIDRRLQDPSLRQLAEQLYLGAVSHRAEIDAKLTEFAENWSVARMAIVDRNILRLAAHELIYVPATPRKVAMDEAIELAKRFGTAESSAFVNGILDRLAQTLPAPEA